MYGLSQQLNMSMKDLYQKIVWPLQTADIHANDVFKRALLDFEGVLSKLDLDEKLAAAFKRELEKRFPLQEKKVNFIYKGGSKLRERALFLVWTRHLYEFYLENIASRSLKSEKSDICILSVTSSSHPSNNHTPLPNSKTTPTHLLTHPNS